MCLEHIGRNTIDHALNGVPEDLVHHCECGGDQENREGHLVMEPVGENRLFPKLFMLTITRAPPKQITIRMLDIRIVMLISIVSFK